MALYALGDLHLGFQVNKPMDRFGKVWKHHERKIEKYVNQMVKPEDTLVLTGDHSWGRKLEECREDLAFIERLPGHKILLRGNHDMFWDEEREEQANKLGAREMDRLRESFRMAEEAGYRKFIMFLHYPPTNILEETSPFTAIAEEYGVTAVVYSHCHGERRFGDSIRGPFHGISYMLVSGDYLDFHPARILP